MAWIEVHQALWTHRKTLALADALDLPEPYAAAHLIALWTWALDNAPDGALPRSARIIARGAQWTGNVDTLIEALLAAGWLDEDADCYRIHDWWDYAGKLIERREQNAERMRVARAAKVAQRATHVQRTSSARAPATQPYPTQPNHDAPTEQRTAGAVPRPDRPGEPAAKGAPAPADAAGTATPSEQETVKDAPKGDDGRVKRPSETPAVRSAPKPNKFGAVLDALKERGVEVAHSGRDTKAVKDCSAAPEVIADAYQAFASGALGDDFTQRNLSLWFVCQRIPAYLAWREHPPSRTNGARASPVGKADIQARSRELLHAIATGGSES